MNAIHVLLLALVLLCAVCSAAPQLASWEDLYGAQPSYNLNRLVKRWSRLEPSIRFAGGSSQAWFQ